MVTIIIVVYKTDFKKLKIFLKKIGNNYPIIIIDNSENYNFNRIISLKNIKIIRSQNVGNGAGINLAIKKIKTKFAVYFDLDTQFKKEIVNNFIKYVKIIKNFALLIPNHGNIKSNNLFCEQKEGEAAVMFFNLNKIKKIGLFDENFFLYFEETDLIKRCKQNFEKVYYLPKLKIKHVRASSIKVNVQKISNLRLWHYMWSMFYYYRKHYGYFFAFNKTAIFLAKDIIKIIWYLLKFDMENVKKRFFRISGLLASMCFSKSYLRP